MFGLVKKNNSNIDKDEYIYDVNFYKLKSGLFKDTYMYIDTSDIYIDDILIKYMIPVKFLSQFNNKEYDFEIGLLSCSKRYSSALENYVFPTLDRILLNKYGNKYNDFIEETVKILHRFLVVGDLDFDIQKI